MVLVRRIPSCPHNRPRCRHCIQYKPTSNFCHTSTASDTTHKRSKGQTGCSLSSQRSRNTKDGEIMHLVLSVVGCCYPRRNIAIERFNTLVGRSLECVCSVCLSQISITDIFQKPPVFYCSLKSYYKAYTLTAIRCHILRPGISCIVSFTLRRSVCSTSALLIY